MEARGCAKTLRIFLRREEGLAAAHAEADRAGGGIPHRLAAAKIEDARHVGPQGLPVEPFRARPHVGLDVIWKRIEGHRAAFGIARLETKFPLAVEQVRHEAVIAFGGHAAGDAEELVPQAPHVHEENDKRIRSAVVGMRRIGIDRTARRRDIDGSSGRAHDDATARC